MTNRFIHLALAAAAVITMSCASWSAGSQSTPDYRLVRTIPLGAPDRWDYLTFDPGSHRVYVAHGDRVTVVDGRDGTIVGAVTGFPGGTHGIAVVSAVGHGYTDDGRTGEAGSFDLKSLKVKKRTQTAEDADGIVFDPPSAHVFVINGDSGTLTVIDPKADRAIATVDAGGGLEFGVSGNNGKLYVNGAAKHEIVRIDTHRNVADAHWPMPGCVSPHGLAIDRTTHRLFSSCANQVLVVLDSDSGAVVATLPIGAGTDDAEFDPRRKRVFSSNGRDGTLSIIEERDAQTFVLLGNLKTAPLARTMTIDPDSGRLFLVAADVDTKAQSDAPSGSPPRRLPVVPGSVKLLMFDPVP